MAQTSKSVFANVSASTTDQVLVAAPTGTFSIIKVVSVAFVTGATATTAVFNSFPVGGPGTAISCIFQNGSNGGAVLNRNEDGWFWTTAGQSLSITTGIGATTGVIVNYILN